MREKYIKHIICVIFTACLLISSFVLSSCSKRTNENTDQSKEEEFNLLANTEQDETSNKEIKEISAGFYLYDEHYNPIYKNQQINVTENMEFNIECVNACNAELNYTVMILLNNHYQKADYHLEDNSEMQDGKGKLGAGDTEKINVMFEPDISRQEKNDIRIVMIYYTDDIPRGDLDMVPVGEVTEKHLLLFDEFENEKKRDNVINKSESYSVDKDGMEKGVWITNQRQNQIPPFDFTINSAEFIYLNIIGNTNGYYGVLLIDGTPQLIQDDCVFYWKQKQTELSVIKIKCNLKQGSKIFVYMYETDSEPVETYISNLYYCE